MRGRMPIVMLQVSKHPLTGLDGWGDGRPEGQAKPESHP